MRKLHEDKKMQSGEWMRGEKGGQREISILGKKGELLQRIYAYNYVSFCFKITG